MTVAEAAVITRPLSRTQAATRRKLLDAARSRRWRLTHHREP